MKRILWILAAVLVLAGCHKEDKKGLDISGDWQLTGVETRTVEYGGEPVDVYLRFEKKAFSLYQKLGEGRYRAYSGSFSLSGTVLTGKYSDGKDWGAGYDVTLDGNTLTLVSRTSSPETDVYTRTTIPQEVIETAE